MKPWKMMAASVAMAGAGLFPSLAFIGPAQADSNLTATVGHITLTSHLLVDVPVNVVCAPLGGSYVVTDLVSVSIQQASGQAVSSGSGQVASGYMYGGGAGLFTCDGSTVNVVTVPVLPAAGSGPFKGGKAIVTVNVYHDTDNCPYGGCGGGGSAGATIGPEALKL
jgi:hypothetical protein